MPKQKSKRTAKKAVVVKMRKSHRIFILTTFSFSFICTLMAMIYVISASDYDIEIVLFLLAVPAFLFLSYPLYYATWQIAFDSDGIQKRLFWINQKRHAWTQVKAVHSAWLISERSFGISIKFKDRKTIRFRMDCENAEQAKKQILSHCSITEYEAPYA